MTQTAKESEEQTRTCLPDDAHKAERSALMASLPDDALKAENIMAVGEEGSSAGTLSQKDNFMEARPSRSSADMMRMEELKLNLHFFERVDEAITETKTNIHGDNVMHERSTDFKKSKTNTGVAAAKSTRKSSLKHSSTRSQVTEYQIKIQSN